MKTFLLCVFLAAGCVRGDAQNKILPTDSFTVHGEVQGDLVVRLSDLSRYKGYDVGDVIIRNHTGAIKDTAYHIQGVLLKDVLSGLVIKAPNPKLLSEYYLVCKASDGYRIVFSWNELFNSQSGEHVYIVTSRGGQLGKDQYDRIALICPQDINTGRRFLKALQEIEIRSAQ